MDKCAIRAVWQAAVDSLHTSLIGQLRRSAKQFKSIGNMDSQRRKLVTEGIHLKSLRWVLDEIVKKGLHSKSIPSIAGML